MRRFRGRIKTANAHFLSFVDGGGVGPADEWLRSFAVHTNLRQREPHTEFLLWLAAGSQIAPGMRFGLRSPTAGFVTAVGGGGVPCLDHIRCPVATDARDNDEHTEIFLEIDESQYPAVITVQTDGGYFLSWNGAASSDALGPVALGVDQMGTNETFVFEGQEDFGGRNWSRRFPSKILSGVLLGDRIWLIADSLYEIDPFTGDTLAANPVGIGATQLIPCGDRLALLSDNKIQLLEPVSGSIQEVKSPLLRRITGPQSAEDSLLLVDRDAGEILQVFPDHTVAHAASSRIELNTGGDFWTPASVAALCGNLYIASGLAINSIVRLDVVSAHSHQLISKFEYFDRFDPVVMTDGLSLALGMRECSDPNNAEFLVFRPDLASVLRKHHHISAPIQDFSGWRMAANSAETVFVPITDGILACNVKSGKLTALPRTGRVLERPVNSSLDRVYFPTTEGIIAVDPGDPRKHARFDPYSEPGDPARERTGVLGASDEVLYGRVGGMAGDFLIGIRTEEFHQTIDIECSLLQDFKYEATAAHDPSMNSDPAEPTKTPTYQVLLRVRQPTRADERDPANANNAPGRPNERLRLEALGQALVGHAGREQVVSSGQPLDLRTDAQGRVRLTVTPGSYGADGKIYPSISCPDLTLSVPFLDPALRFVFNPASYVMQDVAQVTADSLAQAKTYSGSFAVNETYRNNREALEAAAKSLNKAAGIVTSRQEERRAPGAATGLLGPRCASGDADVRPVGRLRRRVTASEGFEFDLTPEHPMFHTMSPGDSGTLRRRSDSRPKRFLSADELWDRIKTGVLAVAEAVVEVVEDGVEVFLWCVEKGVEGVFELGRYALDTVEHACLFIQGIFDKIVDSIEHAIEFLSKIFDWESILRTHDQISNTIRAGFDALQGKRPGMSFEKIAQTIEEHAADVQANVHDTFNSLKQHYGSKSGSMLLAGAPRGGSAVVPDSNDNTWLADKLSDSMLHQRTEQNFAARGQFTLGFELTERMIEAINGLSSTLDGPAGRAAVEALGRLSDDLTALVNGDILGGALNLVLDLVEAVVDVILAISVSGARGLLKLIEAVLAVVEPLLVDTSLAEGIPFFSTFYGWLTGGCAPTLLDIFSLVLAVPTHMGLRAVSELRSSIVTRTETYRPEQAVKRARTAEELALGGILLAMGVAEVIGSIVVTVIEGLWLSDGIPKRVEKIGRGFVLLLEFVNLGLKAAALAVSWTSENVAVNAVLLSNRVTCTFGTCFRAFIEVIPEESPYHYGSNVFKILVDAVLWGSAVVETITGGNHMSGTADQVLLASSIVGCVAALLDIPYSSLSLIIDTERKMIGGVGKAALVKPMVAAAIVLAASVLLRVAGGAIDFAAGVVLLAS